VAVGSLGSAATICENVARLKDAATLLDADDKAFLPDGKQAWPIGGQHSLEKHLV
jgi:hypothetical protein